MLTNNDIFNINKRYSDRLKLNGRSPKTLGWSDKCQQEKRFERFSSNLEIYKKNILDVGCGFGDLYHYLKRKKDYEFNYTGIDINPDLVKEAKILTDNKISFFQINMLDEYQFEFLKTKKFHIIVAIGIFNLNFAGETRKMEKFIDQMITRMNILATEKIIFDFLPLNRLDDYKSEGYIMSYSLDIISKIMAKNKLGYTINCEQSPNPMQEALVVAKKL